MAYLDNLVLLSGTYTPTGVLVPQLVTALGTTVGTNIIDVAPGVGNQTSDQSGANVLITVVQSLTSAGAATVMFQLVQADDQALSVNANILAATDAFPYATLTAKTLVPLQWTKVAPFLPRRYFGLRFVVAGAALTNASGQFTASVGTDGVPSSALMPIYRSGIAVS